MDVGLLLLFFLMEVLDIFFRQGIMDYSKCQQLKKISKPDSLCYKSYNGP